MKSISCMNLVLGVKFFSAGEGPLRVARRMRAEARSIAGAAHVAEIETFFRMRHLESRLKIRMVRHALTEAISYQDDALALRGGFRLSQCGKNWRECQGG